MAFGCAITPPAGGVSAKETENSSLPVLRRVTYTASIDDFNSAIDWLRAWALASPFAKAAFASVILAALLAMAALIALLTSSERLESFASFSKKLFAKRLVTSASDTRFSNSTFSDD